MSKFLKGKFDLTLDAVRTAITADGACGLYPGYPLPANFDWTDDCVRRSMEMIRDHFKGGKFQERLLRLGQKTYPLIDWMEIEDIVPDELHIFLRLTDLLLALLIDEVQGFVPLGVWLTALHFCKRASGLSCVRVCICVFASYHQVVRIHGQVEGERLITEALFALGIRIRFYTTKGNVRAWGSMNGPEKVPYRV